MLAHPSMAQRLKLTDEQKANIAALMTERGDAMAKATGQQRARVIDQFDQRLAAVLTDAQREDLVNNPPEPLLRFNYRFQRWIDVLEEVARQAGLSLVLRGPPPGTFNYSDTKDYTATEAIDLVNGVLSTKGYTLIRREKMLLVVDMSEGISGGPDPADSPRGVGEPRQVRDGQRAVSAEGPHAGHRGDGDQAAVGPLWQDRAAARHRPAPDHGYGRDHEGDFRADRVDARPAAPPAKPEPPGAPGVPNVRRAIRPR